MMGCTNEAIQWVDRGFNWVEVKGECGRTGYYSGRWWPVYCDECRDAGWAENQCDGTQQCGMPSCAVTNYAHHYVKKCDCWETNPVLIRARDQAKRYAVAPAQAKRRRS